MKALYNQVLNFYTQLEEYIQSNDIVLEYMSLLSRLFLLHISDYTSGDIESFKLLFESLKTFIYYYFGVEVEPGLY